MKRLFLIGSLSGLAILIGVVLVVGRGPEPQNPYVRVDPQKTDPKAPVDKEALIKDIDYYQALINSAHADPFRQITKQSFMLKTAEINSKAGFFSSCPTSRTLRQWSFPQYSKTTNSVRSLDKKREGGRLSRAIRSPSKCLIPRCWLSFPLPFWPCRATTRREACSLMSRWHILWKTKSVERIST